MLSAARRSAHHVVSATVTLTVAPSSAGRLGSHRGLGAKVQVRFLAKGTHESLDGPDATVREKHSHGVDAWDFI